MADEKINLKQFPPLPNEEILDADIVHVNRNGIDYKTTGNNLLKGSDIIDDLNNTSTDKAASANSANKLYKQSLWQNRADGILFAFDRIFEIERTGTNLLITIPQGKVIDINSGTLLSFNEQAADSIDKGGGITCSINGTVVTFAFVADISTVTEGEDLNLFVIAKNVNGLMVSRLPSVQHSLYPTTTTVTNLSWAFNPLTSDSDPDLGKFKMNNTDPALVTEVYFSIESFQGVDVSEVLAGITVGTEVQIIQRNNGSRFILGQAGAVVNAGDYYKVPVTIIDSGALFNDNEECNTSLYLEQEETASDITRIYQNIEVDTAFLNVDFTGLNEVWATNTTGEAIEVDENITLIFENTDAATTGNVLLSVLNATREVNIGTDFQSNDARYNPVSGIIILEVGFYLLRVQFNPSFKVLEILPETFGADRKYGLVFDFNDQTIDVDPQANNISFNSADLSLATFMFVSKTMNNIDISDLTQNAKIGSRFLMYQTVDNTKFISVRVVGAIIDAGTYVKYPIEVLDSGLTFDLGAVISLYPDLEQVDANLNVNGFFDVENIDLTFDVPSNTVTLTPVGSSYKFIVTDGREYEKTGDSIIITPVDGLIAIYYDNEGVLQEQANPTKDGSYDLLKEFLPVCVVTYNGTLGQIKFVGDYMKGVTDIGWWVKNFFDFQVYKFDGIAVFDLTGGGGAVDADAQFGLSAGSILFVDRKYPVPLRQAVDPWTVVYFDATPSSVTFASAFPVVTDVDLGVGATGRIAFNNNGSPIAVANNDYVWYFVAIGISTDENTRTVSIMGNGDYGTENAAQNNLEVEIQAVEAQLTAQQGISLTYAVLYQTQNGDANAVKGSIIDFVEIIRTGVGSVATPAIPSDLINGGDASSLHMHDSIYLNKANTDPYTPTEDYHPVTKLYLEENAGGGGHEYKENNTAKTQRAGRNIITNASKEVLIDDAAQDETEEIWQFEVGVDVDPTGKNDGDVWGYNAASEKTVPNATKPFDESLRNPEAVNATGLLSTILLAGYKLTALVIENNGDDPQLIDMGYPTAGDQNIVASQSIVAGYNEVPLATATGIFASALNDTDMYIDSDGTVLNLTLYYRFEKII